MAKKLLTRRRSTHRDKNRLPRPGDVMIVVMRAYAIFFCGLAIGGSAVAESLIVNGGFEEPAEGPATTITNWRRWQSTPQSVYRVTEPVRGGSWALFMQMDPARGAQIVQQQMAEYEPGQLYEIVFWAMSAEPYDSFTVDVLDRHPSMQGKAPIVSQAFTNREWTLCSVRFNAPKEAGHPLLLRFGPRGPKMDSGCYLDDVQVVAVSDVAVEFTEAYAEVELDTFNAIVRLTYDLAVVFDVAKWRIEDLAHYKAADQRQMAQLRSQAQEVEAEIQSRLNALEAKRAQGLFPGIVLSALPDDEIAEKRRQLQRLQTELSTGIEAARDDLMPQMVALREQVDAAAPGWQPPAERTATYHPSTLSDRFHRIISYHGYMPATEYLHRSMWELKPTAIQGYMNHLQRRDSRVEFFRLNQPRTMAYIESVRFPGFPMDLTSAYEVIDELFDTIGDEPSFSGIQIDEPSISEADVTTPEGYAQFRHWLAGRYNRDVGGYSLADAMAWERAENLDSEFDQVMWMELQQFRTHHFARQLKSVQDYVASKNPDIVFHTVIQQYLPTQPQYCSYVTIPAALDWISMDPYNNANVGEALLMDLLRSNSKGPNLLVVGTCHTSTAGRFAKDMSISFAHTGGVYNWCWVYMAKHRAPDGVTRGAWPPRFRNYWKNGMYESAQDIMGKMADIEPYLVHTETGGNVGLIYSERTGIYCSRPDVRNTYYVNNLGIYQALQQLQIPTEAIFAEAMTPERLAKFRLLILADAELLTPEETGLLSMWCHHGGTIIAFGGVGVRDQWGREHDNYGDLTELFGVRRTETQTGAAAWSLQEGQSVKMGEGWQYDAIEIDTQTAEAVGHFENGDAAVVRNRHGKGHAYLLTGRNLGYSFDGSRYLKGMYKRYWPGFHDNLRRLLVEGVREAGARIPMRAENAPSNVELGLRRQGDRLVTHLLNYDDDGPVSGMALIAEGRAGQVALIPEDGSEIRTQDRGGNLLIPVRDFEHHICIVVEPR